MVRIVTLTILAAATMLHIDCMLLSLPWFSLMVSSSLPILIRYSIAQCQVNFKLDWIYQKIYYDASCLIYESEWSSLSVISKTTVCIHLGNSRFILLSCSAYSSTSVMGTGFEMKTSYGLLSSVVFEDQLSALHALLTIATPNRVMHIIQGLPWPSGIGTSGIGKNVILQCLLPLFCHGEANAATAVDVINFIKKPRFSDEQFQVEKDDDKWTLLWKIQSVKPLDVRKKTFVNRLLVLLHVLAMQKEHSSMHDTENELFLEHGKHISNQWHQFLYKTESFNNPVEIHHYTLPLPTLESVVRLLTESRRVSSGPRYCHIFEKTLTWYVLSYMMVNGTCLICNIYGCRCSDESCNLRMVCTYTSYS